MLEEVKPEDSKIEGEGEKGEGEEGEGEDGEKKDDEDGMMTREETEVNATASLMTYIFFFFHLGTFSHFSRLICKL